MAEIDFSNQRALLIEDMAEARILQKKMLTDFGFKQIELAMKAESAIELLRSNTYDVVLSDYNLGSGKDGQQLLEEVRHSNLIPNTSTYLMVTAETSIEMVMGAIEYQPDGYISKPFSQALLQRRLLKLVESKQKLYEVNHALDQKKYEQAIDEAVKVVEEHPFLESKCSRIKGECFLELKQYDNAIDLFQTALKERKMPWALFGLAKAHFFKGNYEEAESRFRQLMLDNRFFVNAYDWLAKCLVKLDKKEEAQATLIDAVAKSPKAILRQIELGELSAELNDFETSEMSFRRAVFLAKHSIYSDSSIYFQHLKSFIGIAKEHELSNRQVDNFKITLKKIQKLFGDNPKIKSGAYEIEIELFITQDKLNQAKSAHLLYKQDVEMGLAAPESDRFKKKLEPLLGESSEES
jgi:CheY-like chemotaxis protein/TolA-binding protein